MATPDSKSARSNGASIGPIPLNTLRFTISPREYKLLHEYLISRSPTTVKKKAPQPTSYEAAVRSRDDYSASAIRAALRVFIATGTGLTLWDIIMAQVVGGGKPKKRIRPKIALIKSPNFRLSLSVSLILLLHRLLHRFFVRLRANLLTEHARPFRRRNPRVSKTLTSRLAPAIGSSLAGFALGIYPGDQLRITMAIYVATRSLEFAYNALEEEGWFKDRRPWWFGSWLLMPATCGQLLDAFVFEKDCFPAAYGNFIMRFSDTYLQQPPPSYPKSLPWPTTNQVVECLGEMAHLKWPPYVSPTMFPSTSTLPATLAPVSPLTSRAHPLIKSLSCATLHPHDPSCLRVYLTFYLNAFPRLVKIFTLLLGLLSLPRALFQLKRKSGAAFSLLPSFLLNNLSARVLRMSAFVAGSVGTSWASICLFQVLFPRSFLPRLRFLLGGALGGSFAFLDRHHGRSNFLYTLRASMDSLWKVGTKKRWWKGVSGGDVCVFVLGLMLTNAIYEAYPAAVDSGPLRKCLGVLRGEGWVDRAGNNNEVRGRY